MNSIDILKEFDSKKNQYISLCAISVQLVRDLIRANDIVVHSLSQRTKGRKNLEEKLIRKGHKYKTLSEVTDISGIRIVTYFAEDVDKIADLINKEFQVDKKNTIDKRNLDDDRFGYMSMHYVVEISKERLKLSEYKTFKNMKFEIQIRSILQHGWAEIEHDLGYKGAKGIPTEFKRDFNRIAALLETADKEFNRLRNELLSYDDEIEKSYSKKVKPKSLAVNNSTIRQFLEQNKDLNEINRAIAKYYTVHLDNNPVEPDLGDLSENLKRNNIDTINKLSELITENKDDIIKNLSNLIAIDNDRGEVTGVNYMVGVYKLIDFLKE